MKVLRKLYAPPQFLRHVVLATVLGTMLLAGLVEAAKPHHPGHWSASDTWGYTPIHLILAPGPGSNHSQVLWWQSDHHHVPIPNEELNGGRWTWNPSADACSFSNFTDVGLPSTGENIFCAGHTVLGDGNVLVSGGTEPGTENGIKSQKVFDTLRGEWVSPAPSDMGWHRWYPSTTVLGDGRVLVTSGSRAANLYLLGGRTVGSVLASDSLHRFLLAERGFWDPSVKETGGGQGWPDSREGATLVSSRAGFAGLYLFGGEGATGFKNDVWWLKAHGSPYQRSDQYFSSRSLTPAGTPPIARSGHTSVMRSDTMIVLGGRSVDGSETVFDDIWVGWQSDIDEWQWRELTPVGSMAPSARFGHAAVFDTQHDRMLLFGGIEGTGGPLADSSVWALTVDIASEEATWDTVTITGALRPGPRFGHTTSYDIDAFAAPDGRVDRSIVMFGGDRGGQNYTNELWRLWLHSDGSAHWSLEPDTDSDLPSARAGHSAAIIAGTREVVIFGGETTAGRDSFAYSVRLFDEDDTEHEADWEELSSWHQSLSGHVGVLSSLLNMARVPEIYDPLNGTWDQLDQAPLGQHWYPFTFSAPGGAFSAGPSDSSWKLNLSSEAWSRFPSTSSSGFNGGSAVMLGSRVMKAGSGLGEAGSSSIGTTKSIDLEDTSPAWAASTNMLPRYNHNLVILPTGEVLVVGGTQSVGNHVTDAQNRPEIWDPDGSSGGSTGVWYGGSGSDTLAADPFLRDYHSTAVLLPDGRVLSAGGNADEDQRTTANIYCPPYLFDSNGNTVARPAVSSVSRYASYEGDIDIITSEDDSITSVCLIRAGAATHGFNQSQRYVELEWTYATNPNRIVAVAPEDPDYAPPGDYLLFVLKESPDSQSEVSIPSIGRWVRLSSDAIPPAKRNLAADLVSQTSIGIDWISPGDDDTIGTAQKYELRWGFSPITATNWQGAGVIPNDPTPKVSGSYHLLAVNGLSPCTPYYFALLTRDEASNFSTISDTISARTMCSGGGGIGESARQVAAVEEPAPTAGGPSAAEAPESPAGPVDEVNGVTIGDGRRQGLTSGSGHQGHHMVVEFEKSGSSIR